DAKGRATFTFRMPDALGRWRITGRAVTDAGIVGQRAAWIASDKPLYVKWAGPMRFRESDAPVIDVVVFNRTSGETTADLAITGAGLDLTRPLTLAPGANHLTLPVPRVEAGAVTLQLTHGGGVADSLATTLAVIPAVWTASRSMTVPITAPRTPLS